MMKDPEEKNEYRHKQAAACHSAATASSVAEVRQAFLELEQGWRQLIGAAPEASASPDAGPEKKVAKAKSRRKRHQS
jgi:hypothetical protein